MRKQGDSSICCTELYRKIQKMHKYVCKHCCKHPPCGNDTSNLGTFDHKNKSDFGRGSG